MESVSTTCIIKTANGFTLTSKDGKPLEEPVWDALPMVYGIGYLKQGEHFYTLGGEKVEIHHGQLIDIIHCWVVQELSSELFIGEVKRIHRNWRLSNILRISQFGWCDQNSFIVKVNDVWQRHYEFGGGLMQDPDFKPEYCDREIIESCWNAELLEIISGNSLNVNPDEFARKRQRFYMEQSEKLIFAINELYAGKKQEIISAQTNLSISTLAKLKLEQGVRKRFSEV